MDAERLRRVRAAQQDWSEAAAIQNEEEAEKKRVAAEEAHVRALAKAALEPRVGGAGGCCMSCVLGTLAAAA